MVPEINQELDAREKALEERKQASQSATEKRRQEILDARAAKKQAAEERRQKIIEDRARVQQEKIDARNGIDKTDDKSEETTKVIETKTEA